MILIVISITLISLVLVVASDTYLIYAQNAQKQTKYQAKLDGDSVVPPVNTTAAGKAYFIIDNHKLWWKLNVTGIADPTMAHIHMAKKGVNGTIVADLFNRSSFENTTGRMIIRGDVYPPELQGPMKSKTLTDLESVMKARGLSIDLHTKNHPDGELRGTIRIQGGQSDNTTKQTADTVNTTLTT